MNSKRLPEQGAGHDDLRRALVAHCQLSVADEEAITALMRKTGMSFVEAALHLGLINSNDVEDTIAWAKRRQSSAQPSLIESAISKVTPYRKPAMTEGVPARLSPELQAVIKTDDARSEALRALRTELLLTEGTTARGHSRVITIMSPLPQEGRSQLVAELAVTFAQLGRRTLLIDADLRHPKQHELFRISNDVGLTTALISPDPPQLHPVDGVPYLAILNSGHVPPNPIELLSDDRLSKLLMNLRGTYEFIVIDTPPVAKYADGLAVAAVAGEVLVVSRAQHTTQKEMRNLLKRMASTRAQVLGAILSHF